MSKKIPSWLVPIIKYLVALILGGGTTYAITSCGNKYDNSTSPTSPSTINVAPVARQQIIGGYPHDTVYILVPQSTSSLPVTSNYDYED